MKCHFCSKDCELVPSEEYFTLGKEMCNNHPYLVRGYYRKKEPGWIHFTFYPILKNKKYRVLIEMVDSQIRCTISTVMQYNEFSAIPTRKDIVSFDFDPGITPENILQKLPTILTFL